MRSIPTAGFSKGDMIYPSRDKQKSTIYYSAELLIYAALCKGVSYAAFISIHKGLRG